MGAGAERRYAKLNRKQIDEISANESNWNASIRLAVDNKLATMRSQLDAKDQEIEQLKSELERAKRFYHLRNAELKVVKDELAQCKTSHQFTCSMNADLVVQLEKERSQFARIMKIVRLAIDPERWQMFSRIVDEG